MVWSSRLKEIALPTLAGAAAVAAVAAGGAAGFALLAIAFAAGTAALVTSSRGRQAATAELRDAEAAHRTAAVVAETAGALLDARCEPAIADPRVDGALAGVGARLQMCHAPAPREGETALPVKAGGASGWLYLDRDGPLSRAEAEVLLERVAGLASVAHDRTRALAGAAGAEAARQADLAKTSVMHAMAHDLREPVAALAAATADLGDEALSDHERTQLTEILRRETSELERMVDDLLDLSRIEAGATNPQRESCDLADLLTTAVDTVCSQRTGCTVRVNIPDDLPQVNIDRVQVERVFTSLIENAAKFSPPDRGIEIRGLCANGRVTIRVIDHGQGIAPAQQSQVFKPFVRGSGPESGSGLGLAICRGFVEANGGRITLQSGARDGSAFAVSFPAVAQPSPVA